MDRSSQEEAVEAFYDTHPINRRQIVDKLRRDGFDPANVDEDILQNYDQDHYGGVAANDALAALTGLDADSSVLDICCGIGGPSRYLAHNYGCRVTGIDLTESRVLAARELAEMTGLSDRVAYTTGNALDLPFADASFDIAISQEAFCHIPDKARLVAQCARVIRPAGRIAFTDILKTDAMRADSEARLEAEMAYAQLGSADSYRQALEAAGCSLVDYQDLSGEWRDILVERLGMYRSLKDQTVEQFGAEHFDLWDSAYSFFVSRYQTGELGGGRFLARKP